MDLLSQANDLLARSQAHRRHLHQYPELSLQENATSEYCQKVLVDLGYRVSACWKTGFIADYVHDETLPFIAWRADMDALPIQEKNNHAYTSQHAGVAHMCGHDAHMSIALTAAELLLGHVAQLKANVRFVFQPAEEVPPGGALGMIAAGCLENVCAIYGLHNHPGLPCGEIATRTGPLLAAADSFELQIHGRGGHAARPQETLDPIVVMAHLIAQWQQIIARQINPAHPAVLSVCQVSSGSTFNVIPSQAQLQGTVRSFDAADRAHIQEAMCQYFAPYQAQGFQFDWQYTAGYDAVVNPPEGVAALAEAAQDILPTAAIDLDFEPTGWGEDFAYYLQQRPGCFFLLGSGNQAKGISEPLHSDRFDIDEGALAIGAAIAARLFLL